MKNKAIKDAMNIIKNRIGYVYNQGYEDGLKDGKTSVQIDETEAYEAGLEAAWELARKMYQYNPVNNKQLCEELFDMNFNEFICTISPSEAIAEIKEFEVKQKMVEDAEIKVGDEVIYCGGAHDGSVGVVLGTEKDWVEVRFKSSWNCVGVHKDSLTKTGRHFSQIEEVLEQMKGE